MDGDGVCISLFRPHDIIRSQLLLRAPVPTPAIFLYDDDRLHFRPRRRGDVASPRRTPRLATGLTLNSILFTDKQQWRLAIIVDCMHSHWTCLQQRFVRSLAPFPPDKASRQEPQARICRGDRRLQHDSG